MKEIFLYCYFSSHSIIYNCTKKNWVLTWILKNVEKCLSSLFKFLKNTRKICKQANKFIHSILKLYRLKKKQLQHSETNVYFSILPASNLNSIWILPEYSERKCIRAQINFPVEYRSWNSTYSTREKREEEEGSRLASFENYTGARVCYTVKITC